MSCISFIYRHLARVEEITRGGVLQTLTQNEIMTGIDTGQGGVASRRAGAGQQEAGLSSGLILRNFLFRFTFSQESIQGGTTDPQDFGGPHLVPPDML